MEDHYKLVTGQFGGGALVIAAHFHIEVHSVINNLQLHTLSVCFQCYTVSLA